MRQKCVLIIALVGLAFAGWVTVRAQSGGGYDLTWNTVDGGGGVNRSGAYTLGSAIGQPDAGTLSGGNYTLASGFWQSEVSAEPTAYHVYLPLVIRSLDSLYGVR